MKTATPPAIDPDAADAVLAITRPRAGSGFEYSMAAATPGEEREAADLLGRLWAALDGAGVPRDVAALAATKSLAAFAGRPARPPQAARLSQEHSAGGAQLRPVWIA